MAVARFKDLCVDAADAGRLGAFWAGALDREWHARDDGIGRLSGPTPQHTVWLNPVPEPKTVKHRVHLDVYTRRLDDLIALGAAPVEMCAGWTIMTDPEDGEFCAFLREELPADRLHGLVVDSRDPPTIAAWWAEVFGGRIVPEQEGWATVEEVPGMPIQTMDFVPVPEPKTVQNRVHWDVVGASADLLDRGATMLRPHDDEIGWDVLADPEGNEFCVFAED